MCVVNLQKHITDNWDEYSRLLRDDDSKIHVNGPIAFDNNGPSSLILTVGDNYFLDGKTMTIPKKGIKVSPGKCIVVETMQKISVPYNMFGIITGIGANIFQKGFIATGKIDNGFQGKLKISYFNGNEKSAIFRKNDLLALCSFFYSEEKIGFQLEDYNNSAPILEKNTLLSDLVKFVKNNWYSMLALLVSFITMIKTLYQ